MGQSPFYDYDYGCFIYEMSKTGHAQETEILCPRCAGS
jgi:hypothetical protein